ncbi:apelin receptor-like [Anneissia japonica]|uniref:apelin receptor-like n=1 Tax=Anneissia japonica TaxID=1529436 RepID=UPI00142585E1|nr:apelin receptor-like [Anneissia japonica]
MAYIDDCDEYFNLSGIKSFDDFRPIDFNMTMNRFSDVYVLYLKKVYIALLAFGLVNNALFLYVMFRVQRMHSGTNALLSSLAISDMIFLFVAIGEKIVRCHSNWCVYDVRNTTVSILSQIVIETSYHASLLSITLVAHVRYSSIFKHRIDNNPSLMRQIFKRYRITSFFNLDTTKKQISFVWITGFTFALMLLPLKLNFKVNCLIWPDDDVYSAYPIVSVELLEADGILWAYGCLMEGLPFALAFVFSCYCYLKLIRAYSDHVKRSATEGRHKQRRHRLSTMLALNNTIYFVCLAPYCVPYLIGGLIYFFNQTAGKSLVDYLKFGGIVGDFLVGALYLNASISASLYTTISPSYRRAYREALCCQNS